MDKGKLTQKEEALLAEARREAQARKDAADRAPAPAAAAAQPASPRPDPKPAPATAGPKPAPTAAERLAQLMEEERAETLERKRKMRRYGIIVPGAILAVFALWLLSAFRRRR